MSAAVDNCKYMSNSFPDSDSPFSIRMIDYTKLSIEEPEKDAD